MLKNIPAVITAKLIKENKKYIINNYVFIAIVKIKNKLYSH